MQRLHRVAELTGEFFAVMGGEKFVVCPLHKSNRFILAGGHLIDCLSSQEFPARRHAHKQAGNLDMLHISHWAAVSGIPVDPPHGVLAIAVVIQRPHGGGGPVVVDRHDSCAVHHVMGHGLRVFRAAYRIDDLYRRGAVRMDQLSWLAGMGHQTDILGVELVVEENLICAGDHQRFIVTVVSFALLDLFPAFQGVGQDLIVAFPLLLLEAPDELIGEGGAFFLEPVGFLKEIVYRVQVHPVIFGYHGGIKAEQLHGGVAPVGIQQHNPISRGQLGIIWIGKELLRPLEHLGTVFRDGLISGHQGCTATVAHKNDILHTG